MSIDKLNLQELQDGIDSLEKWGEVHEEILDELVAVRELLEENKGESIDRIVEAIESLEDVVHESVEEIFKKHKEVTNYKERIEESGVVATSSDAYIFIEDADELRKKIQRLLNEVEGNKRIHVNKANKTNISFGLKREEKEDLREYIDKRNNDLTKAKTFVESKIYEMETELKEALNSAKQLEEMEDADLKFSIEHYNKVRKAIEIKVKIKKATNNVDVNVGSMKKLNVVNTSGSNIIDSQEITGSMMGGVGVGIKLGEYGAPFAEISAGVIEIGAGISIGIATLLDDLFVMGVLDDPFTLYIAGELISIGINSLSDGTIRAVEITKYNNYYNDMARAIEGVMSPNEMCKFLAESYSIYSTYGSVAEYIQDGIKGDVSEQMQDAALALDMFFIKNEGLLPTYGDSCQDLLDEINLDAFVEFTESLNDKK